MNFLRKASGHLYKYRDNYYSIGGIGTYIYGASTSIIRAKVGDEFPIGVIGWIYGAMIWPVTLPIYLRVKYYKD